MSVARTSDTGALGATLLFSLLLHGVLLLGITFHFAAPKPALPTLDVTLVNVANHEAPDKADFLAQTSNSGGGNSDRAARPSQQVSGALPIPTQGTAAEQVQATTPAPQQPTDSRMLTTRGDSSFSVDSATDRAPVQTSETSTDTERRRAEEMARLAAEVRQQSQAYAKRPKKKYISANTQEYAYAAYMRVWSDRVQRVGNLNYPQQARRKKLYGELMLTVGLDRSGAITSMQVIKSSGMPLLDAAAERIVRLAAPFPAIPRDKGVDELYITRTWQFLPGDVLRDK